MTVPKSTSAPAVHALKTADKAVVGNADRPIRADEAATNADRATDPRALVGAGNRPAAVTGAIDIADLPERNREISVTKPSPSGDDEDDEDEDGDGFPKPVYNPFIPAVRFRVGSQGGWHRFAAGRYVAHTEEALQAALATVAYHRRGDGLNFVGDDRKREWVCREPACGFRTANEAAKDAHELYSHQ